jgi:hypothetical protein
LELACDESSSERYWVLGWGRIETGAAPRKPTPQCPRHPTGRDRCCSDGAAQLAGASRSPRLAGIIWLLVFLFLADATTTFVDDLNHCFDDPDPARCD